MWRRGCFSPQRYDDGDVRMALAQLPRLVGGYAEAAAKSGAEADEEVGNALMKSIQARMLPASSQYVVPSSLCHECQSLCTSVRDMHAGFMLRWRTVGTRLQPCWSPASS